MARLLLDVNIWVALFDDAHIFSAEANALIQRPRVKIATCALVENGVVRAELRPPRPAGPGSRSRSTATRPQRA